MARMPGAIWKPLAADWASQPRMRAYDFFCIHTMVGSLVGTDGYFRVGNGTGYGGTESHFGVGPDGTIYQWQDTDFQADANGNGNWHVISSENADTGAPFPAWAGSDVPALTPQQVEANARIAVWLYRTHGIPLGIAGSSKPGARGLAVHRYGVPGYMPVGAEQWSSSTGKACPGDRRIAQLPAISARAQQLLGGAPTQEDDMPLNDDDLRKLHDAVWFGTSGARLIPNELTGAGEWAKTALGSMTARIGRDILAPQVTALRAEVAALRAGESIDVDEVTTRISEAVSAKLVGSIGTVVRDVLGEDNAKQADEIVDRLAARLGTPAA